MVAPPGAYRPNATTFLKKLPAIAQFPSSQHPHLRCVSSTQSVKVLKDPDLLRSRAKCCLDTREGRHFGERCTMADVGSIQQAKLVLLGDMGAGKSSLVLRFVKGQFFDYQVLNIKVAPISRDATLPYLALEGAKFS